MRNINKLIKEKNKITEKLEKAILDKMDRIARENHVDKIIMTAYSTTIIRFGTEIEIEEIIKLENLYADNVNSGGFEGIWTKKNKWR